MVSWFLRRTTSPGISAGSPGSSDVVSGWLMVTCLAVAAFMPNWRKLTRELFAPPPEFSSWNCFAVTIDTSAVGCFVVLSFHRKESALYSISLPMIALASVSLQQVIVVVGSSRRMTHLPHNSLGTVWDIAAVANVAKMMVVQNIRVIRAPPPLCLKVVNYDSG